MFGALGDAQFRTRTCALTVALGLTRPRVTPNAPVPLDRRSPRSAVTSLGDDAVVTFAAPPFWFLNLAAARFMSAVADRTATTDSALTSRNLIECFVVGVSHRGRQPVTVPVTVSPASPAAPDAAAALRTARTRRAAVLASSAP